VKGGEKLRFGDIVICVASIAVIFALIAFPLEILLFSALGISHMSNWGYLVSLIVSILVSTLISGYIFAGKLWEARRGSITKVAVLWAALVLLFGLHIPGLASWAPKLEEEYRVAYPGTTLSTNEWYTWELINVDGFSFLMVGISLVLAFIGLYAGSMLRRPVKSRE